MKKFVSESLSDFMNEAEVKSKRKTKAGQKVVMDETTEEKAKRAIASLKDQLKKADQIEKKSIQDKIDKWEAKLKK